MKSKLLVLLKTVFKNMGVSDKAFTGAAEYLATTVKEEATGDEIKTIVNGVEPLLKSFQGDIDSRVTAAVEKARKEAAKKVTGETTTEDEPAQDKDTPEWAKKLFDQNKTLSEKLANFESGQTQKTLVEKLNAKIAEKKIPAQFAKGRTVEKEEDIETVAAEIESDFLEVKQSFVNEGLAAGVPPLSGKGAPAKAKIEADITGWADKHSPKQTAAEAKLIKAGVGSVCVVICFQIFSVA